MLLRKRIAAIVMAVVLLITTAFLLPENALASDDIGVATPMDAVATEEVETTTEAFATEAPSEKESIIGMSLEELEPYFNDVDFINQLTEEEMNYLMELYWGADEEEAITYAGESISKSGLISSFTYGGSTDYHTVSYFSVGGLKGVCTDYDRSAPTDCSLSAAACSVVDTWSGSYGKDSLYYKAMFFGYGTWSSSYPTLKAKCYSGFSDSSQVISVTGFVASNILNNTGANYTSVNDPTGLNGDFYNYIQSATVPAYVTVSRTAPSITFTSTTGAAEGTDSFKLKSRSGYESYGLTTGKIKHNGSSPVFIQVPEGLTMYDGSDKEIGTSGQNIEVAGNTAIWFSAPASYSGNTDIEVQARNIWFNVWAVTPVNQAAHSHQRLGVFNEGWTEAKTFLLTIQNNCSIAIQKESTNPDITNENSKYSLQGATYGVYERKGYAATDTNRLYTLTTDASGYAYLDDIAIPADGAYYVKELTAPMGYNLSSTIYTINVSDANTAANRATPIEGNIKETPQMDPIDLVVRKQRQNTDGTTSDVMLEGAKFVVKYYKTVDTSGTPERTWHFVTDEEGKIGYLPEYLDIRKNNSDLYLSQDGNYNIPYGTITIQEYEAPEGYVLDDTILTFVIDETTANLPLIERENARTVTNVPMTQAFDFTKYGETKDGKTSPLAGAGFSACRTDDLVVVADDYQPKENEEVVTAQGKSYIWDASKCVVLTADGKTELFTDSNGYARTIALEYGAYIIKETTVPATYLPVAPFVADITKNSSEPLYVGDYTDNLDIAGQIRIHKTGQDRTYDEDLGEFITTEIDLEGVVFDIYAAEDNSSSDGKTSYKKDEFVGTMTTDKEGNAASGVLPLGTYVLKEHTPEGYIAIENEYVTLDRNCETDDALTASENKVVVYKLAEIKNIQYVPEIGTTAKDSVSLNSTAEPSEKTTLIDTVSYKSLIPGKEYTIKTVLMDKETNKPLLIDGKEVTATTTFVPEEANGSVDISVTFNSSELYEKEVVFFERVYADEKLVAIHADIEDEGQTITFPPKPPVETPPEEIPPIPKTGDETPVGMIVVVMMVCLVGIVGFTLMRRKNK